MQAGIWSMWVFHAGLRFRDAVRKMMRAPWGAEARVVEMAAMCRQAMREKGWCHPGRAGAGLRVPLSPGCGGPGDRRDRCQFHGSRQGAWTVLGGRQRAPTWMNAESTLIVSGSDSRLAASASGLAGPVQSGSCSRQRGCDHLGRVRALERR